MSGSDHTQGRRSQRWEEKKRKEGWKEGEMDSTVSDRSLLLRAGQFGGVGWAGKEGDEPRARELRSNWEYSVQSTGTPRRVRTLHTFQGCGGYGWVWLDMACILPGTTVRYGNGLGGRRSGEETGASRIMNANNAN